MPQGSSVMLPYHPDPGFSTECYHQLRLSILMTDERTRPWLYSRFVLLKMHYAMSEQFPMLRLEDHLDVYADILKEDPVCCEGTWTDTIRSCLRAGEYVLLYLNWKHIPCSNHFRKQDLFHEALIYGFDDAKRQFHLLGFDVGGSLYSSAAVDYDVLEREFIRHVAEDTPAQQWFAHYGYPISRLSMKEGAAFPQKVDARRLYFALDRGRSGADGGGTQVFALGYTVHEMMASYFDQLGKGRDLDVAEYSFWNVMIYKMIQHNKFMQHRLAYLMQTEPGAVMAKVQLFYVASGKGLQRIRALSLQVQRTGAKDGPEKISLAFREVFEKERRAVALWMSELNQQKLRDAGVIPSVQPRGDVP
ncbi:hypothetical protein [Paenibacillus chitinolyticus]|uniref:hypothetical protein n=1 Tax=Paenibacillus chitinolyticus TaxID=79263 RepID=UPI00364F88ED